MNSLEDEWRRHGEATEAVTLYCDVLESRPLWGRHKQTKPEPVISKVGLLQDAAKADDDPKKEEDLDRSLRDALLRATKEHIDMAQTDRTADKSKRPILVCFQCFGDERLPVEIRCKMYYDHGCLSRHFRAKHLKDEHFGCNYCDISLLHKMDLQRHAKGVHRVHT